LWEQEWDGGGTTIVQPALTGDGDLLINAIATSGGLGLRRLNVTHGSNGWNVSERWTSTGLKPYFNDFVVHKGHAFGFDGNILACIDLSDGHRKWKGGRYGNGQLILLAAEDLLLVLSEDGELALVKATPDHSRRWRASRPSKEKPGTIQCSFVTRCSSGTARRWPHSSWRSTCGESHHV
jgi:outer membrane protein assembly factor BamB